MSLSPKEHRAAAIHTAVPDGGRRISRHRGVRGEGSNPRVQVFRVRLKRAGPTQARAEPLLTAFDMRCPIYATLARAVPIEMTAEVVGD